MQHVIMTGHVPNVEISTSHLERFVTWESATHQSPDPRSVPYYCTMSWSSFYFKPLSPTNPTPPTPTRAREYPSFKKSVFLFYLFVIFLCVIMFSCICRLQNLTRTLVSWQDASLPIDCFFFLLDLQMLLVSCRKWNTYLSVALQNKRRLREAGSVRNVIT